MADEQPPVTPAAGRGRRALRLFLMVAGGLAAPCLALAAFFVTNTGGTPSTHQATPQPSRTTVTTAPGRGLPSPVAVTTTSTTAPVPSGPRRDPFVPLVTQGPAGPGAH
jgi:hypothetical protein